VESPNPQLPLPNADIQVSFRIKYVAEGVAYLEGAAVLVWQRAFGYRSTTRIQSPGISSDIRLTPPTEIRNLSRHCTSLLWLRALLPRRYAILRGL